MVFLDQKTQYCHNDYTIQGNLQIKTSICENIQGIFPQNQNNPKTCMEPIKTSNNQSNLEKEEHSCPRFQNIQQSYGHQNSMALAKKRYRDQLNRLEHPQINPHSYVTQFMIKQAGICNGERQPLQKMVFDKPKGYMQKTKSPQKCTLCNYVKNRKNVHNSLRSCFNIR